MFPFVMLAKTASVAITSQRKSARESGEEYLGQEESG